MKPKGIAGFSRIELLVIILVLAVLATFLADYIHTRKDRSNAQKARRIICINNLKNIALAFRIYSPVASEFAPKQLLEAGTPIESVNAVKVFQLHSNQLADPKLLTCPADAGRLRPRSFQSLQKQNLSYFASLSADDTTFALFVAGDRNLLTNGRPIAALFPLLSNQGHEITWSRASNKATLPWATAASNR
jgi:hypothetical protein